MPLASLLHDLYIIGVFAAYLALAVPFLFLIRYWAEGPKDKRNRS